MSETKESTRIRLTTDNYLVWRPEKPKDLSGSIKKNESAYVEIIDHIDAENMAFVGGAVPDSLDFDDQAPEPAALLMTLTLDQFNCPHCWKLFKICGHCQTTGHSAFAVGGSSLATQSNNKDSSYFLSL
ncbi:uncharacterized protein VP01_4067g2 [Puccinia sorghi]|uniref:Uncharacterized protein n=1 Tax=Puccinia sorghi TaxID=27349 RepID=A0A0L6UTG1_9BASI|nr:uncharacterized protein VP01_4067g2 [Puccinia sorghi]